MSIGESYIGHHLNTSKTKQAHVFPKEDRFSKASRLATEAIYNLPSTQAKRSTCFGFGNKISLANKTSSPPPGSYQTQSDFERKDLGSTPSLGEGREKAMKRYKNNPSPDKYEVETKKVRIGGGLGERIKTDYQLKYKKTIPGPGSYKLTGTEIGRGTYCLSNYKNNLSPRYYTQINPKSKVTNRANTSTVSYDIQEKEVGKYCSSKYKNTAVRTFSKAKRPGLQEKGTLYTPGFKYRRFSEFGGMEQK